MYEPYSIQSASSANIPYKVLGSILAEDLGQQMGTFRTFAYHGEQLLFGDDLLIKNGNFLDNFMLILSSNLQEYN